MGERGGIDVRSCVEQTTAESRTNGPIGAHRWPLELA